MRIRAIVAGMIVVACICVMLIAAWGVGSEPKFDRSEQVRTWQTYSASPTGVHEWASSSAPYTIHREPSVGADFRSGYALVHNGDLIYRDMGNGEQYRKVLGRFYVKERLFESPHRRFSTATHEFYGNLRDSIVEACVRFGSRSCYGIAIKPGTFPYDYAASNGSVLVVTNMGDALLFKGGKWCRMEMENDIYECRGDDAPILQVPRKIQFYSSIVYHGMTLLGEWPTGRLYEFDGSALAPSNLTPPEIAKAGPVGYEAQSMAMYCGDLFVGYWPKGQIYRMDGVTKEWSLFASLFDGVSDGNFIPFLRRVKKEGEKEDAAFYGQRVTALVPYEDSLYAVTSNLIGWSRAVNQSVLTSEQAQRYGAVYRIHRQGCRTTYLPQ